MMCVHVCVCMCACVCACVCVCGCTYFDYCMITPSSFIFLPTLYLTLHTSSYRAAEYNGMIGQHLIVINPAHTPETGVQHENIDRIENLPNVLADNNAGAHRPHTSVPSHVDTSQEPTYDSLEKPHHKREPQPYQVPIRTEPAVPQDNPQYAEPHPQETIWRRNMTQHATQTEHTQSTVRGGYAEPDVHHSYNLPTSN